MSVFRVLGEGEAHYHTWTRCVDGRYFFESDAVKSVIRKMIANLCYALSVDLATYTIMSNHYHLLIRIPNKESLDPLTDEQWLDRLSAIHNRDYIDDLRRKFQQARDLASSPEEGERRVATMLQPFEERRADLAVFMKELNHRISLYINDRFERRGTMWESPYGSMLIQGNEGHLLEAAAYIDLNPVRAKMVERPEDYRFCGYAEAVAGKPHARKGLGSILTESLQDDEFNSDWRRTHKRYRLVLYTTGEEIQGDAETGQPGKAGFSEQEVEKVEQAEGEMSVPELLRHRVRYFTAGVVIGSRSYVEEIFQANRHRFGAKRKTGARKLRGGKWGDRYCLRDIQLDVIEP